MRRIKQKIGEHETKGELWQEGINIGEAHGHFQMADHLLRVRRGLEELNGADAPPGWWERCPDREIVTGYYAMYHAAYALLILGGYRSNSHVATIRALEYLYVYERGKLTKADVRQADEKKDLMESIETLNGLRRKRTTASYGIDIEKLEGPLESVRDECGPFVEKMKRIAEEEAGHEFYSG